MRNGLRLGWAVRGATLVAVAASAGCAIDIRANEYTAREEKQFTVAEGVRPEVELVTFDGSIEVRAWERPEVRIEIEKGGATKEAVDAVKVTASQDGPRIRVEALAPSGDDWMAGLVHHRSHYTKLIASVPRESNVRARTGDGSVKVEGVEGKLDGETGDGSVRGVALTGDVMFRTGDGSIRIDAIEGRLVAETEDGSVVIGGKLRGLTARTGDGSVVVRLDAGSQPDDDWRITTDDGAIALELPETIGAEIDASTGDGVVRVDRAFGLERDERRGRSFSGRLGQGGRTITVRSGDGSVTLRKR